MTTLDDARVRRYLLGQLTEPETEALEAEYFARAEALEQVWGVENDLVDAYVAGELEAGERAAFEAHYLASPLHRDRVASARALREAIAGAPRVAAPRARPLMPWLALAAGILLILGAWWVLVRPEPPREIVTQAQPTPTAAPSAESDGPPTPQAPPVARAAFAVSLPSVLLRGGPGAPTFRIPAGAEEVAITLTGGPPEGIADGTRLPFAIATVEGATVARGHVRSTAHGLGVARVGAGRLPPGDYILSVGSDTEGDGPVRRYYFRVLAP